VPQTRRFGILTFPLPPYDAIEREWRWAEDAGFANAWLPEVWSPVVGSARCFEPWTALAALAQATRRLRIGTLVSTLVSRHPTLLAAQALSIDNISGGRVEVGVGPGDEPNDSGFFGERAWSPTERVARLGRELELLDRLLRGEPVSSAADVYSVEGAQLTSPVQHPRPPLVVAAEGRRTLGLVARYAEAWVSLGGQPTAGVRGAASITEGEALVRARERVDWLESNCSAIGRDVREIRRLVLAFRRRVDPLSSIDAFDEFVGAYAGIGFSEFIFYWPPLATLHEAGGIRPDRRVAAERIISSRLEPSRDA
jgi:alkanesulfonate monooxygenase SsuD/methylene tetrahydromethanopterin reductase-like flavin-dependent oxidoreductase (luciferase family)